VVVGSGDRGDLGFIRVKKWRPVIWPFWVRPMNKGGRLEKKDNRGDDGPSVRIGEKEGKSSPYVGLRRGGGIQILLAERAATNLPGYLLHVKGGGEMKHRPGEGRDQGESVLFGGDTARDPDLEELFEKTSLSGKILRRDG